MVLGIQSTRAPGVAVSRNGSERSPEMLETAASLAPEQPSGVGYSSARLASDAPTEAELGAAFAVTSAVLGDPVMMMIALQTKLRDQSTDNEETRVEQSSDQSELADAFRATELAKAAKMAEKAAKKAPPWVKKLIGAIVSAVGAIASIAGGAGIALVAVGAALIVGAKIVEKVMTKLAEEGLISEKAAMIVSTVVKIAAAVAATVTGQVGELANAAKAAMEVVSVAVKIVKSIADMVQAASDVAFAGVDMHSSVRNFQAEMANIMAEQWGIQSDGSISNMESAVDGIRQLEQSHTRMMKTATSALAIQDRTRMTAVQGMA